ncbi:MAG: SDR family NAD(P)-dependent oxidoreductase, partial [Acidimicrobiia bacterium]
AAVRAAHGVEVRTASVDLTAHDMGARLAGATDGLDVGLVVYNAGAGSGVPKFLEATREQALRLVRLNCVGPVEVAHHFGSRLAARGRGGMIFVTSMAAIVGAARTVTYGATKAFDLVFAEGLWAELGPHGVDVLALVAGATDTPALAATGARAGGDTVAMMPADEVAREGLEHLTDGPTWVAGDANRAGFDFLRTMPRADAVNLLSQATRSLYGFDD